MEWLVLLGAAALAFIEAILLVRMLALYVMARKDLLQASRAVSAAGGQPDQAPLLETLNAAQAALSRAEARSAELEQRLSGLASRADLSAIGSQISPLQARIEAVSEERESVQARIEQMDARVRDLTSLVQQSAQTLEAQRRQESAETQEQAVRLGEAFEALQSQVSGLAGGGEDARQAIGQLRKELAELAERINSESLLRETDVLVAAGEESADRPAAAHGPKMLSATARARYREVLDLWSRGNNARTIAMMTGLDFAEVELMLAGERQPGEPPA